MAQALKYWDGANPKIYVILTQKEGGGWHLACHWTDRILEYDCELVEDRIGQHLRYGSGSILPLRNSKGELYSRWSEATDQDINDRPTLKEPAPAAEEEPLPHKDEEPLSVVTEEQQDEQPMPAEEPLVIVEEKLKEARYDNSAELERLKAENESLRARIAEAEEKRQTEERQCNRNSQGGTITQKPEADDKPSGSGHQILKFVGSVAAMSVALFVIWQTGLLIPLGLIGLATSGLLK